MEDCKTVHIECDCGSPEHDLRFSLDTVDGDFYTEVYLSKQSLLKRLIYAFKYIFGYQSKYGAFDCTLMGEKSIDELQELLIKAKETKLKVKNSG